MWPEPFLEFESSVSAPATSDRQSRYFVFHHGNLLDDKAEHWQGRPNLDGIAGSVAHQHYLGFTPDLDYYCVELTEAGDQEFSNLRMLFGRMDGFIQTLAGRAKQVVDWYNTHQFCGNCGGQCQQHPRDRAMVCASCKISNYPRLSPSIIVLVHRGDEVLLARNHRFPEGMYSTLAGFVEPGEDIEETLMREVREEVGVDVENLSYLGSQPWPFPNSLMLGFHAQYQGGDIVCQEEEIADAKWFHLSKLPAIPGRMAISRWLIDSYLKERGFPLEP